MIEPTTPTENPLQPTQPKRYLTELFIIGLIFASILLNIYAPLWLKPPYLALSSWCYSGLVFVWMPIYVWKRRHTLRQIRTILPMLVGAMMVCCICAVLGPNLRSIFALGVLDQVNCEKIDEGESRVRYECIRKPFEGDIGDEDRTHLNLEGVDWLPIVWRVE